MCMAAMLEVLIVLSDLTDGDADVEELTEEEAEGVLVELVMNVLTVVPQQGGLLLAGVLHHHVCTASHQKCHHAALRGEPDTPRNVEENCL